MKLHLDTDIGGDMDDLCALAMLLKWPGVEITGITTTAEEGGRRAGFVARVLDLAGRSDIPFAAGADVANGYYRSSIGYPDDVENWGDSPPRCPGPLDDALKLMKRSIDQGATIVGIGPYTNFRLLDERYPGSLRQANVVLMGGYIYDIPEGYPQWWDRSYDWNMQMDIRSAVHVLERAAPLLVPLPITVRTALRRAYLPRLAEAGSLGELIVRQAGACARAYHNEANYQEHCPALPPDTINMQHDPLTCAIALGWHDGVAMDTVPLRLEVRGGLFYEYPDPSGIPTRIVTAIDAPRFNELWLETICA
ncbi:MAG: nucleoside hydrolase [Chloroflexi bacterium]|nr:nucleoside hydrolase [Chloroflexota bacterium]